MNIEKTEQQFSERLENHQAFDLDADLTWDAIEKELDKKKKKRGILFFFPLGLGCLMGILAVYTLFVRSDFNAGSRADNDQGVSTLRSYLYPQQGILGTSDVFQSIQLRGNELWGVPGRFQYGVIQEICFFNTNQVLSESGEKAIQNTNIPLASAQKHSFTAIGKQTETSERKKRTIAIAETETSIQNRSQATTPLLEQIPIPYLKIPAEQVVLTIAANRVEVERPKPQYQLEAAAMLYQITNGLHAKNGGDNAYLRKNSETPQPSWFVAGNLWRTSPAGWLTGIGLEYGETWVKFRYQKEETNNLLLENIPIHYLIDAHTHDTVAQQNGDVSLSQYNKRDVQHFNSFQTLSLPLHFGFIKPGQQKMTYGLVGGLRFHYHLKQSGRLLTENATITAFSTDSYFRRTGLSAHLEPVLILKSGTHWQLSCRPSVAYSLLNSVKTGMGVVQRSFTYGLSLGIRREL